MASAAASTMLLAGCGGPDDAADPPAPGEGEIDEIALQARLDEWRAAEGAYGATLSVRVPGHDDVHLASGVDDREPETPMPTDGTYDVFSVTKSFTAAAALQLVDEGRLSLDEPVAEWLPELPNADEITLAMLLDHTAGVGTWTGPPEVADDWIATLLDDPGRAFTPEELLAEHLAQPLVGQPGEREHYTNAAYDAVGLLIERELAQDLADVFEERFFAPLELDETELSDGSTRPTRHGWFSLDGAAGDPIDIHDFPDHTALKTTMWAAGGMISSSTDLLDWGAEFYSGELLGERATATMLERELGVEGYCFDPGGCGPGEHELVGKAGGAPWSHVLVTHHRESGTTIVVHANTQAWPLDRFAAEVVRELGLE